MTRATVEGQWKQGCFPLGSPESDVARRRLRDAAGLEQHSYAAATSLLAGRVRQPSVLIFVWTWTVLYAVLGRQRASTWLAVATRYARSHGHDDPIPITLHYPGLASHEQLELQERVIAQLGLGDWERVEPEEDLDLIGPVATAALRQTGPLWPPHAYVMAPLLEAARDGVFLLLTALEDFFTWWRWAPLVGVAARIGGRRPRCRVAQHDPDACGLACAGCASRAHRRRCRGCDRRQKNVRWRSSEPGRQRSPCDATTR